MLIKEIHLSTLKIPLLRPFITALRRTEYVEDIVVSIVTDCGQIGYGSAAATPAITGDSKGAIINALSILGGLLLGKSLANFTGLIELIQSSLINNTSAKAALDIALHDLIAKKLNIPLYQFLGGEEKTLTTLTTISLKDIPAMCTDAKLFVSQGFETLKIKVGLNPLEDLARLKAIREAVPEVSIIADANQGWDAKSACQLIEGVQKQELNIAVLEQPVKAWDLANLKYLRDKSLIPIYADEAIFNLRDATNILHGQIADGLNLKLMKSGGIYNTRAIYDLALAYNTPCMAGCMLESPIALTAMASFVSGRKNIKFIDLDPITMLKENPVVGGVKAKDAKLTLSDKPGLGIESIANLEPILINKD